MAPPGLRTSRVLKTQLKSNFNIYQVSKPEEATGKICCSLIKVPVSSFWVFWVFLAFYT